MDFYAASGLSLLWICFFETIAISWFYGVNRFARNIESMIGSKPNIFWYLCWAIFAPLVMAVSFNIIAHWYRRLIEFMIIHNVMVSNLKIDLILVFRLYSSTTSTHMNQSNMENLENTHIQNGLK